MKSLPDKFPIRYAVIVKIVPKLGETITEDEYKTLWAQTLMYLRKTPINIDENGSNLLLSSYNLFGHNLVGNTKSINISKVTEDKNWGDELKNKLEKLFSDANVPQILLLNKGPSISLSIFSYAGMLEIPIFYKILNSRDSESFLNKSGLLFFDSILSTIKEERTEVLEKIYKLIITGNDPEAMLGVPDSGNFSNFYIPYSGLWKSIDDGWNSGFLCLLDEKTRSSDIRTYEFDEGDEECEKQINVYITDNPTRLMFEEIKSYYKTLAFCRACRRPLPFDYRGQYCPPDVKNIECKRRRDRIRKRKSY